MALMRSGQKNLDEIQQIRVALEGNNPVVSGAQRELIDKYTALLGEDGKAMVEDIEEEAKKPSKLAADVFRLIDSCLHSLGQRAKRQELSNEVIKQKEPERLMQVEAIGEHTTRLAVARINGDSTTVESIRQATLVLVEKFMEAVDKDKDEGLDLDTSERGRTRCTRSRLRQGSTSLQRASVGTAWDRQHPREQRTVWLLSSRPSNWQPTLWRPWQGRHKTLTRPR
jgi:hypothetical protein